MQWLAPILGTALRLALRRCVEVCQCHCRCAGRCPVQHPAGDAGVRGVAAHHCHGQRVDQRRRDGGPIHPVLQPVRCVWRVVFTIACGSNCSFTSLMGRADLLPLLRSVGCCRCHTSSCYVFALNVPCLLIRDVCVLLSDCPTRFYAAPVKPRLRPSCPRLFPAPSPSRTRTRSSNRVQSQ